MKKLLAFLSAGLLIGAFFAAALPALAALPIFLPVQGGTGTGVIPSYGQVLVGNGAGSYAVEATSSLNIISSNTLSATYPLNITGNVISTVATSSLNLTTSSFLSPNISQWTNNAGYLTSLSGAASSTLLGDSNTFSGVDSFSNASSNFSGTWQTFSPSHFLTSAITSIGPVGQTQSGATQTLATSSAVSDSGLTVGLTIVGSGNTQTFTPTFTGTISGLSNANFTSSNISQWTNNSGYITDPFTHPSYGGSATSSLLTLTGGLLINNASSTIVGNATTTGTFYAGTASSTLLFGDSLSTCNTGGVSALTWSAGAFGCNTISPSSGSPYPFTPGTFGSTNTSATSTALNDTAGLISTASSTISLLTVNNGTTTNATSTSLDVSGPLTNGSGTGLALETSGHFSTYGGASACTNQVSNGAISASGGTTCTSINNAYWSGTQLSVANGGTNATAFSGNAIIGSNAAGTTLIATGTPELTIGYLNGTSTAATSTLMSSLMIGNTENNGYLLGTSTLLQMSSSTNNFLQAIIANTSATADASSDLVVNNNLSTNNSYFGDFGIDSSVYSNATYTGEAVNDVFLQSSDSNLDIEAASTTGAFGINFFTGGVLTANKRMSISSTGAITMSNLTAGTGNGAVCATSAGVIEYSAGANCVASAGGAAYPFTPSTYGSSNTSATSSILESIGFVSTASSTIGGGAQNSGLTINGGATTTGFIVEQSTATSTFVGGLQSTNIALTSSTATSTAANGFNLTSGCYAVNGTCVGGSAAAGTNIQTFSSSGTWTMPNGATAVMVIMWGGGGAGGTGFNSNGNGGAGGEYATATFAASTISSPVTVTVGTGGTGVTGSGTAGNNGNNSSFGSYLTAEGGLGGPAGSGANTGGSCVNEVGVSVNGLWGAGVASGNGQSGIYCGGGGSNVGPANGGNSEYGGAGGGGNQGTSNGSGGTSTYGGAGGNANGSGTGGVGSVPGGGGGSTQSTHTSGAGGNGKVIVISW